VVAAAATVAGLGGIGVVELGAGGEEFEEPGDAGEAEPDGGEDAVVAGIAE
jgi:hypothetical protein